MRSLLTGSSAGQEQWPGYFRFLPAFLFRPDEPRPLYVLKAWLLALLPSLALSALVGALVRPTETPDIPVDGSISFLLLVVVGPFLETLIMVLPLFGLKRLFGSGPAVLASALLWAAAHSFVMPVWGLIVWWPFLILSIAMLVLRERGIVTAILMVTVVHGLQNATAGLLLVAQTG